MLWLRILVAAHVVSVRLGRGHRLARCLLPVLVELGEQASQQLSLSVPPGSLIRWLHRLDDRGVQRSGVMQRLSGLAIDIPARFGLVVRLYDAKA